MEFTAKDAKEHSDKVNNVLMNSEISIITELIKEASTRGEYNVVFQRTLMIETAKCLEEAGFKIEDKGRLREPQFIISWENPSNSIIVKEEKPPLKFYKDGIIGKGLISEENYIAYVNDLISRFENVSWGGKGSYSTEYSDVVVVLERGIRGPAHWFYLNKEHKWAHGGYTAYKETYTNSEFLIYIAKILEHNKKYEKAIEDQEKTK